MIGSILTEFWLPRASSLHAEGMDAAFLDVVKVGFAAFVLFAGLVIVYARLYRRQDRNQVGAASGGLHPVFLGLWLLAAVALGATALTSGLDVLVDDTVAPTSATPISVVVGQDGWEFTHPRDFVDDTLHVAAGQPVDLSLTSLDVEYGLNVPDLRIAKTVRPDASNRVWFAATEPGTYALYSDVVSGDDIAGHLTAVVVREASAHAAWALSVDDVYKGRTMAEAGEFLANRTGCAVCHSTNGDPLVGPTFRNLYGYEFETTDGGAALADDAYIRESILDPAASIIAGFQPVMTPYGAMLDDKDIEAITAWLKTLSDKADDGSDGEDVR